MRFLFSFVVTLAFSSCVSDQHSLCLYVGDAFNPSIEGGVVFDHYLDERGEPVKELLYRVDDVREVIPDDCYISNKVKRAVVSTQTKSFVVSSNGFAVSVLGDEGWLPRKFKERCDPGRYLFR